MNRNKSLMFLAVAIALVLPTCAYGDLIGYWTFDNSGADSVGSNTGTLNNGAAITTSDYKIGSGGLSLDGTDDYVEMASAAVNDNMGHYTVSMWFKTDDANIGVFYYEFGTSGTWLRQENAQYIRGLAGDATAAVIASTGTVHYNNNQWHQITLTGSGGTDVAAYIDGTKYVSTGTYNISATNAAPLIGAGKNAAGTVTYFLGGCIDDAGVWNVALNDAEATALYSLGNETTLRYGTGDAEVLFDAFDAMSSGVTSDGKTWQYTTGLTGGIGTLVNGGTALVLDASGNGVSIVPEPGTLALLACGLLGLLAYAWRKRK